jgi:hypothetical protein
MQGEAVHGRYLRLVEAIESRFDVTAWRYGDVDLWPPLRMDLFLDLFRSEGGETAPPARPLLRRLAGSLATPLTNAWKSRRDLEHWLPWPRAADAILLGDGVSLDSIDGAWSDRHGEPVIEALERQGRSTFVMQPGGLNRLPWRRPTFAANGIAVQGALAAALDRIGRLEAPDHAAVLGFLSQEGVDAPSLGWSQIAQRGRTIGATARVFQRVLRSVRPQLAFLVTYYAGLGHAFALACRREGVMSVDLQHCPQEGMHRAYRWSRMPRRGYSTLPSAFWTWTLEDAAHIAAWADESPEPWHMAVHGGHSELTPFLVEGDPVAARWRQRVSAAAGTREFQKEILVALQPIGGRRAVWTALSEQIEASPPDWRWWIRRHPSSSPFQDAEYAGLLDLRRDNVLTGGAAGLPLPALLARMDALVSLASGAAVEASAFGVPALFLDDEAKDVFPGLIERRQAETVAVNRLIGRIAALPARPGRPAWAPPPPIEETLQRLVRMAGYYRRLCRERPLDRCGD